MENECKYISVRGLKRLSTFKSDIYFSDTTDGSDYLNQMLKSDKMFDGMSIFICSNLLEHFVNNILDKITNKFILISGMSVKTCPVEALNQANFFKLINNSYLIRWCSQNNTIQKFPSIVQIPLGIDYHSVYNNPKAWKQIVDGDTPLNQEQYLINIVNKSKPFYQRIKKIYVNYDVNADRFGQRRDCLKKIHPSLLKMYQKKIRRTNTWENTIQYAFVLSPYGQGMDCHRTWEALILGSIPIIKSKEFVKMFEDLPVLIVNDWSEINQALLDKTIEAFKNRTFNYDKLTLEFWKQKCFNF